MINRRQTANMISLQSARRNDTQAGDLVRYLGEDAAVIERVNARCVRIQTKTGATLVNIRNVTRIN